MRLPATLPEWADERRTSILAGVEEIARYEPGEGWRIKEGRCNRCGACCGDCPHLVRITEKFTACGLGGKMPWECMTSDGAGKPECSVTWRKG